MEIMLSGADPEFKKGGGPIGKIKKIALNQWFFSSWHVGIDTGSATDFSTYRSSRENRVDWVV